MVKTSAHVELSAALEKRANWFSGIKSALPGIGNAAKRVGSNPVFQAGVAVPVATAGVDMGINAIGKIMGAKRKAKSYQEMMAESPQLRRMPEDRVRKYYNTLHRFNPDMASDPITSAGWVLNAMRQGDDVINPHQAFATSFNDMAKMKRLEDEKGTYFRDTVDRVGKNINLVSSIQDAKEYDRLYRRQQNPISRTWDNLNREADTPIGRAAMSAVGRPASIIPNMANAVDANVSGYQRLKDRFGRSQEPGTLSGRTNGPYGRTGGQAWGNRVGIRDQREDESKRRR